MRLTQVNLILVGPFVSIFAFAQEHEAASEHAVAGAEHHGVPWNSITSQSVNFIVFAALLIFLLRKPIKEFFSSKAKDFLDSVRKAEEVKFQAERAHGEIQNRLKNLEQNAKVNVAEAEKEALVLRERMIREAKEAAIKTEHEAERSIYHEHERSIAALRSELVTNSVRFAQDKVKGSADSRVIEELQQGFGKKVGEARR